MFQQITSTLTTLYDSAADNLPSVGVSVAALWALHLLNAVLGYRLNRFGLVPRTRQGLRGVVFCHFLHGNWGLGCSGA